MGSYFIPVIRIVFLGPPCNIIPSHVTWLAHRHPSPLTHGVNQVPPTSPLTQAGSERGNSQEVPARSWWWKKSWRCPRCPIGNSCIYIYVYSRYVVVQVSGNSPKLPSISVWKKSLIDHMLLASGTVRGWNPKFENSQGYHFPFENCNSFRFA